MLGKLLVVALIATALYYMGFPFWIAWVGCLVLGFYISRSSR